MSSSKRAADGEKRGQQKKRRKGAKGRTQKNFDMSKYVQRYVAIKMAYFGHNYRGFAIQDSTKETIEEYLFCALKKTCLIESRESCRFTVSGRTDAGVSAVGQVIALSLRSKQLAATATDDGSEGAQNLLPRSEELDYVAIVNRQLPPDIRLLAWEDVPKTFSARFSPVSRTYRYFFARRSLDIKKMQEAAQLLVGKHDFRNFCKMNVISVKNFEREILSFEVRPASLAVREGERARSSLPSQEEEGRAMYMFEVKGRAFLWHQVRMMSAVLFLIGSGDEDASVIAELLDTTKHPRRPQYNMAPEGPLILCDTGFQNLSFRRSDCFGLPWILKLYEKTWNELAIKATMALTFLSVTKDLDPGGGDYPIRTDYVNGFKAGTDAYVPLLSRETAMSEKERIENLSEYRQKQRSDYMNYKQQGPSEREIAIKGRGDHGQ